MHSTISALAFALLILLAACGSDDSKKKDSSPAPTNNNVPTQSNDLDDRDYSNEDIPDPDYSYQQDDSDSGDQPTTDPYGNPYDQNAEIPYDQQYGQTNPYGYDPNSPQYYGEVNQAIYGVANYQPNYVVIPGSGYRYKKRGHYYRHHRRFHNHHRHFKKVKRGHGRWDDHNYEHARGHFNKSHRYLTAGVYEDARREKEQLRQYGDPRGRERQIDRAIRSRNAPQVVDALDRWADDLAGEQSHGGERRRGDRDHNRNRDGRRA